MVTFSSGSISECLAHQCDGVFNLAFEIFTLYFGDQRFHPVGFISSKPPYTHICNSCELSGTPSNFINAIIFFFPESLCKPLSYLRISLNHFILFFVEASVWQFYYLRKQSYKTFIISTVRIPVTPFYIPMTRTTVLSTYIDKVVYPYTIVEFLDHPTRLLSVSKAVCVLWIWMTANLEGTRAIWSSFISPF